MDLGSDGMEPNLRQEHVVCSNKSQLTEERGQHLLFFKERIKDYNLTIEAVNCTYQTIGTIYRKPTPTHLFASQIGLLTFSFLQKKFGSRSNHPEKLSVLLMGTDAVSRYNAIRHMPKTYQYAVEKLGALDFRGYIKIGENTLPNMYEIMFGFTIQEIGKHECVQKTRYQDSCPIIWKDFDQEGYLTAYGEDVYPRGIFDYGYNGFTDHPVDLSPLNAYMIAGRTAHYLQGYPSIYSNCEGPRMRIGVFHNYSLAVAEEFKDVPYFGFYMSGTLTHDGYVMPRIVDDKLIRLMTEFHENGYLNHTVVFLFSDHGLRYGPYRHTYIGRIEERLPLFLAVFPPWFKKVYPLPWKNLVTNTRRLISNLDFHETLHSLAHGDFATNTIRAKVPGRGQSLFEEVPDTRICSDVNVNEFFCACEISVGVSIVDPAVIAAAEAATQDINILLQPFSDCVTLRMDKVMSARLVLPSNSTQSQYEKHKVATYIIEFQTQPGGALLEAMVRKNQQNFTVVGEPLRTNKHSTQSHCLKHKFKKYCYCKDLLQP
nr:uncharacterized protein LOC128690499 [Cherax quadricarinatus]